MLNWQTFNFSKDKLGLQEVQRLEIIKIGGQSGIAGHLEIGKNVTIAGKVVTKNLADGSIVAGFPAKDIKEWKKDIIKIRKINDIK